MSFVIHQGDALTVLRGMADKSIDCCVSSPPYFGLRSYSTEPQSWGGALDCQHRWGDVQLKRGPGGGNGSTSQVAGRAAFEKGVRKSRGRSQGQWCQVCDAWLGELGAEPTPELYVEHVVSVFREVRRVIRGSLWLNIGDSWAAGGNGGHNKGEYFHGHTKRGGDFAGIKKTPPPGLKPKDLVGVPWMLAFALRADGWYLRQEIIWEKPACMPESVRDRPTRSHEQVFLLAPSLKYYYDADAIKEPASKDTHARYGRAHSGYEPPGQKGHTGAAIAPRKPGVNPKAVDKQSGHGRRHAGFNERWEVKQNESFSAAVKDIVEFRNKRSVWRIANEPNFEEHFAAFPIALVEPCILAGSPVDGTVLDPFAGLGTVGNACLKHGRNFVGIELNASYAAMARARVENHQPLFANAPLQSPSGGPLV